MGKSNISYLDHVWSPVTGCSGRNCQAQCYAREMVKRFPAIHGWDGVDTECGSEVDPIPFNEVQFHPDRLDEPLHRKKATVYGVGFFGDWMDDQVKADWLDDVMAMMHQCYWHQFVTLTKQAVNLRERIKDYYPMPNIWHGVTVCTQAEADERIPELLKVPGKKWISIEPMLGPIDLKPQWLREAHTLNQQISLCVVGGESGKNARPLHPDWARSVRNQCQAAGVPFYFKQHGEWAWVGGQKKRPNTQMRICRGGEVEPTIYTEKTLPKRSFLMFGTECVVSRVGLKAAGRTLDGRIWDELPWRKA